MAQNNVIDQLSDALPANITRMISGYILTLESGGLNETVQKALNSVSTAEYSKRCHSSTIKHSFVL